MASAAKNSRFSDRVQDYDIRSPRRWRRRIARCMLASLWAVSGMALAQVPVNAFADFEKRIRSAEMVGALKPDLFGDSVSLYNGATEFQATDVSIPGNNSLPVSLSRRFKVDVKINHTLTPTGWSSVIHPLGGFGAWDIDVPYLHGMFDMSYGWKVGQGDVNRCSGALLPRVTWPFEVNDIWSGYHVRIPGKGDQELSLLGAVHAKPADGNVYRWGTRDLSRARCLTSTINYPGEGFALVDPQGTTYTFNHAITRDGGVIEKGGVTVGRQQVFLMATRVQDRHGNYVDYHYNGDKLNQIASSDGRVIDIYWSGSSISRVVANGREWKYFYGTLMTVELPDHSTWIYEHLGALGVTPAQPLDDGGACSESLPATAPPFSMVVTHPSGAKARFDFAYLRHGRSGTPASACTVDSIDEYGTVYRSLKLPDYSYTFSLWLKTITGPGLPEMQWLYEWQDPTTGRVDLDPSAPYCGFCDIDKSAFVTEPSGVKKEHVFGALWNHNEGRLLAVHTRDAADALVRSEVYEYVTESEVQAGVPFPDKHGEFTASDNAAGLYNRPQKRVTIGQDGSTFNSHVLSFDSFARPLSTHKYSSLGYTKTEATAYHDSLASWTLGQIKKQTVIDNGVVTSQTDYYADTALPQRVYGPGTNTTQGKLVQTLTYDTTSSVASGQRGTIKTVADGRGNVTTFSGWKRGTPQHILHPVTAESPSGAVESAVINDDGTIDTVVDETGSKTCYAYDLIGRLASITYPSETQVGVCDASHWNQRLFSFAPVASPEYGIAAGHWKQTVSTGGARKVTYLDAFWRPLVEENYDIADPGNTRTIVARRFDTDGQLAFQSYPIGTLSTYADTTLLGTKTSYDALGRVWLVVQNSEQGDLTTRTEYLPGFLRRITNPRGFATTQHFQVFDVPSHELPVKIDGPAGTSTTISRNLLGMPKEMTRTGPDG